MTSLSASLGILTPQVSWQSSWELEVEAGREQLKLDKVQFLQCSQGLRRHSGGKKPENDAVLLTLCL